MQGTHDDVLQVIEIRLPADPADHVRDSWPALIAAVTDETGIVTGAHRTWLDPSGKAKAPISTPRRAMGLLLGNGVRFGKASDVLAAGEGGSSTARTLSPLLAARGYAVLGLPYYNPGYDPGDLTPGLLSTIRSELDAAREAKAA